MERESVERKVMTVLASVLGEDLARAAGMTRQNTLTWNSLKHLEIMFALEEELGVEFSEDQLAELDSASKIVTAAMARHEA
jgi:acyl carrier protein